MASTRLPTLTRSLAAALGCTLLLPGCGRVDESVAYVPGTSFREELFITADRGPVVRARVGEAIVLSAQRRSGPWRAVPSSEVEEGTCALASPPVELEAEVADNVTWMVEPEGSATFNTGLRDDRTRVVIFDRAGVYRLTAQSASWCGEPFGADTLRVEIRE